jgi:hypothetical protein
MSAARVCLSALFLFVLGLASSPAGRAEDKKPIDREACSRVCSGCALDCEACNAECAKRVANGEKKMYNSQRMSRDCADVCALTARVLARRGPTWRVMCDACARSCEACAKICSDNKDCECCTTCVKTCRACAKACRDLLAADKKKPK